MAGRLVFRRMLVAGQVAVATALVVCSGLMLRNLWKTESVPLGFQARSALLATVAPSVVPSYRGAIAQQFVRDFADAARALPHVTGVTLARRIPLAPNGGGASVEVDLPDARGPDGKLPQIHFNAVAPNYFAVMGTRLLAGTGFPTRLGPSDPKIVVINEAMAQKYWPNGHALGQTLRVTDAGTFSIAGIVETGKYIDVAESPDPYMFFSLDQMPSGETTVVVATPQPADAAPALRAALARLEPRMPMTLLTLDEHLSFAMYQAKAFAGGSTCIGIAGLVLSLVGLYAVISFVVTRRRRDIGIRMALGAEARDVVLDVLRQTATLVGAGMVVGIWLAVAAAGILSSSSMNLSRFDPLTYTAAIVVVGVASLLAVWYPSRQAARIDPAVTLRD